MGLNKKTTKHLFISVVITIILICIILGVNISNIDGDLKNMITSIAFFSLIIFSIGYRIYFASLIDKERENKDKNHMK